MSVDGMRSPSVATAGNGEDGVLAWLGLSSLHRTDRNRLDRRRSACLLRCLFAGWNEGCHGDPFGRCYHVGPCHRYCRSVHISWQQLGTGG